MRSQLLAVWAILRKDLRLSIQRPAVSVITILPALVLILEAAAVTQDPVAVVDRDPSCGAARTLQHIATSFDGFSTKVESAAAAQRDYADLHVATVLTIPGDFCAALAAHQHATVEWQVRNFNADSTNDLERGVADVLTRFMASGAAGPDPIHIRIVEHDLHAQDASFVGFQLVAVLVLLLRAGLINAGLAAAMEWQTRSVKELLLAPVSPLTLVAGKVLAGVVAADVAGSLLLVAAMERLHGDAGEGDGALEASHLGGLLQPLPVLVPLRPRGALQGASDRHGALLQVDVRPAPTDGRRSPEPASTEDHPDAAGPRRTASALAWPRACCLLGRPRAAAGARARPRRVARFPPAWPG
jgi:hypothetical protein